MSDENATDSFVSFGFYSDCFGTNYESTVSDPNDGMRIFWLLKSFRLYFEWSFSAEYTTDQSGVYDKTWYNTTSKPRDLICSIPPWPFWTASEFEGGTIRKNKETGINLTFGLSPLLDPYQPELLSAFYGTSLTTCPSQFVGGYPPLINQTSVSLDLKTEDGKEVGLFLMFFYDLNGASATMNFYNVSISDVQYWKPKES